MNPAPSIADIEQTLINEAASLLATAPGEVTPDTPLLNLGLDSLRLFELFVFIEKKFGLRLIEAPLSRQNLESIRALASHIAARLQA
jgi:acyl carrier protein